MKNYEVSFDWYGLAFTLIVVFFAALIIAFYVIPVKMANKRGRSTFGWFLFSLIFSPFLAMLFLFLLGETDEKRNERIINEEKLRNLYRNPNLVNAESNLEKWLIDNSGKSINEYYSKR